MQWHKHCNMILTVHILRLFIFLKAVLVLPSQIFIIHENAIELKRTIWDSGTEAVDYGPP